MQISYLVEKNVKIIALLNWFKLQQQWNHTTLADVVVDVIMITAPKT